MRLIGTDGKQLGIVPLSQALQIAEEEGLDLVEVAPQADPPVCKIMDYGKYKYQLSKKSQEARKKQTVIQVKEVKIRPKTDEHDFQTKLRHIRRFLSQRNKAKITVLFRGREIVYKDQGYQILERIRQELEGEAVVEQMPREEGRNLVMVLAPK
ncbi:bacterial translation initiation factor 3 (bIF-3) [Thermodesulforhabdus norvegica]|uniref:Translation initiation factor IF-3 n=1 Tax=Thermodesulforhabdus norvegica TaxID=39841 RepID=A0A1I4SLA4_9BACT|nr:bacterial translation initiation factor 3 (bIF-3) [Thermodesulforhabdus norvegica]